LAGAVVVTDNPTPKSELSKLEIQDNATAPFIYFDNVSTFGIQAGTIVLDLVAKVIIPDGQGTRNEFVATCHLRCGPDAARDLQGR